MDRLELTKKLASHGFSDRAISFVPTNEKYCLLQQDDKWVIYFVERGIETYFQQFDSENDACEHLFNLLVRRGAAN